MSAEPENQGLIDPMLLPPRDTPYVLADVLEKFVYGCRDQLVLNLEDCHLRFGVDNDFDTITAEFHPHPFRGRKSFVSVRSDKPWKNCIGKEFGWTWLGVNQQGYRDSAMISFDGIEPNILLNTICSSIEVFVVSHVEKALLAGSHRNGKRNAQVKD